MKWIDINWKEAQRSKRKLQDRLARALEDNDINAEKLTINEISVVRHASISSQEST